jgi:hypothetical protein
MIADLHIRNSVRSPDRKPQPQERCQTRSITPHNLSAQSGSSCALGHEAGQHCNGKEGHLLDVVGLRGFGALVFLEAVMVRSQAIFDSEIGKVETYTMSGTLPLTASGAMEALGLALLTV